MFNSRIKRINDLKQQIEQAVEEIKLAEQKVNLEIRPLAMKCMDAKIDFVKLLDQSYALKFFRVREKEKINDILLSVAESIREHINTEELEAIYKKHLDIGGYEEEDEEEMNEFVQDMGKSFIEDMAKEMFGVDVDLSDIGDIDEEMDDIKDRIEHKIFEQQEEEVEAERNRKKNKREQNKIDKVKEEAKKISQTSRKIYTQLVKLLHPDHEQDESQKAWKTEAIKEVTEAYNNNDFFSLLNFQMKYFNNVEGSFDFLSDEQLKYYNKILLEQIQELEFEWEGLTHMGPQASLYHKFCGSEAKMKKEIKKEVKILQEELAMIQEDIDSFSNKKSLRAYLRDYKIQPPAFSLFDIFFK